MTLKKTTHIGLLALALTLAGCGSSVKLNEVPVEDRAGAGAAGSGAAGAGAAGDAARAGAAGAASSAVAPSRARNSRLKASAANKPWR